MSPFNITFYHSNFPWKRKSDTNNENHMLLTTDNKVVFTLGSGISGNIENESNLALIQRAPEMAHLLSDVLHQLSTDLDLETIPGSQKYRMLEERIRTILSREEPKCQ